MTTEFKQDEHETRVLFRWWKGDVIALFIDIPVTNNLYTCNCYQHIGQHGEADPQKIIRESRPAVEGEYCGLKQELEEYPYGYRLKIVQRTPKNALDKRKEIVDGWKAPIEALKL